MKRVEKRILLAAPHMSGRERDYVAEAFATNWIAPLGPHVDAFEKEFAAKIGVRSAAALSSGTAALHLAMILLGVGPGDRVLCSDLTFSASANVIRYQGAEPVFVDSERSSWNLDPALLEAELEAMAAAGKPPKAVIVVHLYGQAADLDPILAACRRHGVPLVEDAAESLGGLYRNRPTGSFGQLGAFSFNGNKIITTSGGGMLVADAPALIDRARFLSTQARDPAPHYEHTTIGYNYRLSNLLAGVGRGQLQVLDQRVEQKRRIFEFYRQALAGVEGIELMPEPAWSRGNRWLTCLLITPERFGADREAVRRHLDALNVEARPVWKPMSLQPVFQGCRVRGGGVAADLFDRGLCLPSGTYLAESELAMVAEALLSTPRKKRLD